MNETESGIPTVSKGDSKDLVVPVEEKLQLWEELRGQGALGRQEMGSEQVSPRK